MKIFLVCILVCACVWTIEAKKKCTTVSWTWPQDFVMLHSSQNIDAFRNNYCYTFRERGIAQSGKYFCWRSRGKDSEGNIIMPPITFRRPFEDDHGDTCMALLELTDPTYVAYPKLFCTPPAIAQEFGATWNYLKFWGFDPARCVGFTGLMVDPWVNNWLCGKKGMKFSTTTCDDDHEGDD